MSTVFGQSFAHPHLGPQPVWRRRLPSALVACLPRRLGTHAPPEQSRKRCVTIREATGDRLPALVQPRTTINTLVGAAAGWKRTATGNLRPRAGTSRCPSRELLAPTTPANDRPSMHNARDAVLDPRPINTTGLAPPRSCSAAIPADRSRPCT
jgi:hypothetical protein